MDRIVMVVSTVGYHWEEVFAGYWAFLEDGCQVDLCTVDGRPPRADPLSMTATGPGALIGLGMPARIAPETPRGEELLEKLEQAGPLSRIDGDGQDAIYLPGGHGCLFDVNRSAQLHRLIGHMHERGCILSGVCHATSTFAFVEVGGRSIVSGHAMTGFPHALDRTLIPFGLVRREFLPLPLVNDDVLRNAGAKLSHLDAARAYVDPRFMRVSLPFITGVGPKAAARVAHAVTKELARRKSPESARPTRVRLDFSSRAGSSSRRRLEVR